MIQTKVDPIKHLVVASSLVGALVAPSPCDADETRASSRHPEPTLVWGATQLLPSPEWLVVDGAASFGLRWQLTPILFSYGARGRVLPWRFFVVEPIVRHSGSTELFVDPEYLSASATGWARWGVRSGVRSYFPLAENGDTLSCSLGASILRRNDASSVAFEVGGYTLFGILGVQLAYVPRFEGRHAMLATLSVRVF